MLYLLKKSLIITLTLCTGLCASIMTFSNAHANNTETGPLINIGVAGMFITSPYKQHDSTLFPFPMIHIEAKHVYVRGLSAGALLWTDDNELNELSVGIAAGLQHFDNDSTNNAQLAHLHDRHMTLDGYAQYILRSQVGHIGVRLSHDILGNADGFLFNAYYKIPIPLGNVILTPGFGFNFETEDRAEYYYAVSHSESASSGLSYYSPSGAFTPYASIEASVKVNDLVNVFASGNVNFLSNEIKDSPMVDENNIYGITLGVTYSF